MIAQDMWCGGSGWMAGESENTKEKKENSKEIVYGASNMQKRICLDIYCLHI